VKERAAARASSASDSEIEKDKAFVAKVKAGVEELQDVVGNEVSEEIGALMEQHGVDVQGAMQALQQAQMQQQQQMMAMGGMGGMMG